MNIGLVREVHQIVNHELVTRFDVVHPAAIGPLGTVKEFKLRHQLRVGLVNVTRPDPNEAESLDHGKLFNGRKSRHPLTRHGERFALASHLEAVIAADQITVFDKPKRERCSTVGAKVLEHHGLAFSASVEHHLLATDLTPQGFAVNFIGPARDVPRVFNEHGKGFLDTLPKMNTIFNGEFRLRNSNALKEL